MNKRRLLTRSEKASKILLASLLAASLSIPALGNVTEASEVQHTEFATSYSVLSDGVYEMAFKTFKINEDVASGMDNRFAKEAKLIVKNGKMSVQMTIDSQNEMIEKMQYRQNNQWIAMDTIEGSRETETRTVSFPVENLEDIVVAHVHVNLYGAIVEQDFRIQLIASDHHFTETVGIKVYNVGTPDVSDLQKHLVGQAEVTNSATSTTVAVTFAKSAGIQSFEIEGQEVEQATQGEKTTFTFKVADLKKLVDGLVEVSDGSKLSTHTIQLRFDVKGAETVVENPFMDISSDENKQAILRLYARGVIKEAEQFHPRQSLTRGQFALLIARTLELSPTGDVGFKDVQQLKDPERQNAINAVAEAGIVKKGGNFHPNDSLTRQQSALMMFRAISYANKKELDFGSSLIYADEYRITDPEARKAFALLYAGEMMTGGTEPDGKVYIHPNKDVQRTHMAKILNGSLKYLVNN